MVDTSTDPSLPAAPAPRPDRPPTVSPLGRAGWCLFDWANSPYPTIIGTFVFAVYFREAVADDPDSGVVLWNWMVALSGVMVAILAPVAGAIADRYPRRKPAILVASAVTILCSSLLWFVAPDAAWAIPALLLVATATIGFEIGVTVNNAMLKDIASPETIGRLSGWGWSLGYFGAILCLVIALFVFVQPDPAPFGLDRQAFEHVRILGPLVAVWFLVFMLPLLLFTPDRPADRPGPGLGAALADGLRELRRGLAMVWRDRTVLRFLMASMAYRDGMAALFSFGGLFAADAYGMTTDQVILFAIALNISAGVGALAFSWMDDAVGSRPTIMLSLVCLILFGSAALAAPGLFWFWVFGVALGLFVGPAQAASRTLMARLAPAGAAAEYFGLYAMAGKATSFLAPLVIATLSSVYDLATAMWSIVAFFVVGLALVWGVRVP